MKSKRIVIPFITVMLVVGGLALLIRTHSPINKSVRPLSDSQANKVIDVDVVSNEDIENLISDCNVIEPDLSRIDALRFNGTKVPYDRSSNTIYIYQSDSVSYEGRLYSNAGDTKLIIKQDDMLTQLEYSKKYNHPFELYLFGPDDVFQVNLVFSGVPSLIIKTEGELPLSENKQDCLLSTTVNNARVVDDSKATVKIGTDEETVSVSIADYSGDFGLSASGTEKYSKYKLYKTKYDDKTLIRAMLSYELWNDISQTDETYRGVRFTELFVNDEYKGLYVIAPKVDQKLVKVNQIDEVENDASKVRECIVSSECSNNSDALVFIQATYAEKNTRDDMVFFSNGHNKVICLPKKIEYGFGLFSNRDLYLSYDFEDRVFPMTDYLDGASGDILKGYEARWKEARTDVISDDSMDEIVDQMSNELLNGGVVYRALTGLGYDGNELLEPMDGWDDEFATTDTDGNRLIGDDVDQALIAKTRIDSQFERYLNKISELRDGIHSRYAAVDNNIYGVKGHVEENEYPVIPENEDGDYINVAFAVGSGENVQTVKLYINDKQAYLFVPAYATSTGAVISFNEALYDVQINMNNVNSGTSFDIKELGGLIAINGEELDFSVLPLRGLPAAFVDNYNGTLEWMESVGKSGKEPGRMCIIRDDGTVDSVSEMRMHIHGQSSANELIKPYKLKYEAPVTLLGMPDSCDWLLQPNSGDASRLRNRLAYQMARDLGFEWTPRSVTVDAWFNGEYKGNYQIIETIEVESDRLNLDDGSFVVCIDPNLEDSEMGFSDEQTIYSIKWPESVTESDLSEIESRVLNVKRCINSLKPTDSLNTISSVIDVDTFVGMYLFNRLTNDWDANISSCYYYYDAGKELFCAGPVWDKDAGFGHDPANVVTPEGDAYISGWPERLFENKEFRELCMEKMQKLEGYDKTITSYIDTWKNESYASFDATRIVNPSVKRMIFKDTEIDCDLLKNAAIGRYDFTVSLLENRDDYIRLLLHRGYEYDDNKWYTFYWPSDDAVMSEELRERICRINFASDIASFQDESTGNVSISDGFPLYDNMRLICF